MPQPTEIVDIGKVLRDEFFTALRERREPKPEKEVIAQFTSEQIQAWEKAQEEADQRITKERETKEKEERYQATQRIFRNSNIPQRYRDCRFSTLNRNLNLEAFDTCKGYVEAGLQWEGHTGLLLKGPPGTGKTSLAVASLIYQIEAHQLLSIKFVPLSLLLQKARESFGTNDRSWHIGELTNGHFVVIDDLGRQRPTEWVVETIYTIISQLYDDNIHVIVTTNATKQQWEDYLDEAVRSRLTEMCFPVVLAGDDLRKAKHD